MRKPREYALYKGDEFIDLGTIKEMSKRLGMAQNTLRFYSSPTQSKRIKSNGYIVIRIEGEEAWVI